MALVHSRERVEHVALDRPRGALRQGEVVHWRALSAEDGARITGGHEAARPVLRAVDRSAFASEHYDEAWQVIARGAEAVIDPGAERRVSALKPAGVHHQQAGAVDRRFGRHGMNERDVVDAIANVRKQVANPFAALAALPELPARFDDSALVFVTTAAECFHFNRFAVHADHCRLVVERVDVTWPAVHE